MEFIQELIEQKETLIKQAEDFKALLSANMGKKLNKRHLGQSPIPTYSDKDGQKFKHYVKQGSGYLEHHNPPIPADLESVDNVIRNAKTAIGRLKYALNNRAELVDKRKRLIKLQDEFENALNEFMSDVSYMESTPSKYCDYFGIRHKVYTSFRREY